MKVSSFIKDFSIYGVGGVVTRFVGLLTTPIYSRFLDTEGMGELELVNAISAVVIILASLEMHSGYARSYYESKSTNSLLALRGSLVIYFFLISVFLILVYLSSYDFIHAWLTIIDVSLLTPIFVSIFPILLITLVLVTIRFEERPILYSIITFLNVAGVAFFGIISVAVYDFGVHGILWSNAIVSWVVCISLFLMLPKYTSFSFELTHFKKVFAYSAPITPSVLGGWLNQNAGRIFIAGSVSLSALGIYSIALKVALIMSMATYAFRLAWSPRAMQYFSEKNSESRFSLTLNYYLIAFGFLTVFIISFGPLLVRVLAPEAFYQAAAFIGFLVVSQMWEGASDILGSGNNWERKTYYNSIGSITGGLISITILYFWIEQGGLLAASVALLVGSLVKVFLSLATSQRNHYIGYSYSSLLALCIVTIIYACFCYLVFIYINVAWWQLSIIYFCVGITIMWIAERVVLKGELVSLVFSCWRSCCR